MAMIDASPTADELTALAGLFSQAGQLLKDYLTSDRGQSDPDFNVLSTAAIELDNAADTIAVMQLDLATTAGAEAVTAINRTTDRLQSAIETRKEITSDLETVQPLVAFGAAIAAGDIASIVTSGNDLYGKLAG